MLLAIFRQPCTAYVVYKAVIWAAVRGVVIGLQIASRISPKMKFGPLSRPFLQVPAMSLAQKVIVSEPGHEPSFEGRPEEGADLYNAILNDTGQLTMGPSQQASKQGALQ